MDFYDRIIMLCKQKGVSRSKMADDIGISRSTPKDWLEKGAVPQFSTMKKIADYFDVPVSYLTDEDIDSLADYESVDTSEFNQPVWRHILKTNQYNEKKAIKAYFEFEKAQAQDALSERTTSDQEIEILRIFKDLTFIEKSKVLVYADELRDNSTKTQSYKLAARDGEKEVELTAAQREQLGKAVNGSKNDDNSDLF